MKKTLLLFAFCFCLLVPFGASAQGHGHGKGMSARTPGDNPPPKIEEMVSDLSVTQKKKLLQVQSLSRERIGKLKAELGEVRDSIRMLMRRDGDNAKALYPLFDREGALQAQIAKEMYAMRTRIDAILTPEQLKELRQAMEKRKGKRG